MYVNNRVGFHVICTCIIFAESKGIGKVDKDIVYSTKGCEARQRLAVGNNDGTYFIHKLALQLYLQYVGLALELTLLATVRGVGRGGSSGSRGTGERSRRGSSPSTRVGPCTP